MYSLKEMGDIVLFGIFPQSSQEGINTLVGIASLSSFDEVKRFIRNSKDKSLNRVGVTIKQAEQTKENLDFLIKLNKKNLKNKYQGSNLVIKSIPKELNDKDLYSILSQYGRVKSAKIKTEGTVKEIRDKDGDIIDKQYVYESKGYGFALYYNHEDADKCVENLNGIPFEYKSVPVLLKIEYFDYDKEKTIKITSNKRNFPNPNYKGKKDKFINKNNGNFNNMNNNNLGNFNSFNNFNNMNTMNNVNNQNQMFLNQQNQQMNNLNYGNNMNPFNNNSVNINNQNTINNNIINQQNNGMKILENLNHNLNQIYNFLLQIKSKGIPNENLAEFVGDSIFNFTISLIENFNLNTLENKKITNEVISSKITGILLGTHNIEEYFMDLGRLVGTIKDLISKLYPIEDN